jgi:hypothetical protein
MESRKRRRKLNSKLRHARIPIRKSIIHMGLATRLSIAAVRLESSSIISFNDAM